MNSPYADYGQEQTGPKMLSQAMPQERTAFLFKVYSLLTVGVLFYFASIAVPMIGLMADIPGLREFAMFFIGMNPLLALGLIIGVSFGAGAIQNIPGLNILGFFGVAFIYGCLTLNLIAYAIFTLGSTPGGGVDLMPGLMVIGQAAFITITAMAGLTAYVFITKKDFSFMGGFLWTGFFIGFGISVIAIVFYALGYGSMLGLDFNMVHTGLSLFFTLLFLGFVLYDTSNILLHYPTTAVVPAAMSLLIDFIILFRNILFLLTSLGDD